MLHGWLRKIGPAVGVAAAILVACGAFSPGAAAGADVELGPRYIDGQNGFSLCPPAGAERSREVAVRRLVRWSQREPASGAIAWTLMVRREPPPEQGKPVKQFAEKLLLTLAAQKDTRVDSIQQGQVLGKEAVFIRTEQGEKARRWTSEVWVLADAERFLALSISGPAGRKDHLEAILREVTATLRLIDPAAQAAARKENLARGAELLKGLTEAKLAAAAAGPPRWYLYRRGDKDIGFLHVEAGPAGKLGRPRGVEVRTTARLELKGGQVMVIRRTMFSAADRSAEEWTESVQVRQDGKVVKALGEEGSRQGGAITCKVTADGKANTRKKALPEGAAGSYLPRALGPLLPRLVDLKTPAACAFAEYTTSADDFDMRTFTVMQPEAVDLAGRTVQAVRAADQVAADAEPAMLHLAPAGDLLRMRTAEGISMEQAEPSAVLRRFPDAEATVKGK